MTGQSNKTFKKKLYHFKNVIYVYRFYFILLSNKRIKSPPTPSMTGHSRLAWVPLAAAASRTSSSVVAAPTAWHRLPPSRHAPSLTTFLPQRRCHLVVASSTTCRHPRNSPTPALGQSKYCIDIVYNTSEIMFFR